MKLTLPKTGDLWKAVNKYPGWTFFIDKASLIENYIKFDCINPGYKNIQGIWDYHTGLYVAFTRGFVPISRGNK